MVFSRQPSRLQRGALDRGEPQANMVKATSRTSAKTRFRPPITEPKQIAWQELASSEFSPTRRQLQRVKTCAAAGRAAFGNARPRLK